MPVDVHNRLLAAFQSPVLGWLTLAFLFTASVVTYAKRIDQYKRTGALPADAPSAPGWVTLFFWIDIPLKIALVVLNWEFGLLVYVLGFALAVLGVLERAGSLLMYPFVRTVLPDYSIRGSNHCDPVVQSIVGRWGKAFFRFHMPLTAVAYLGTSLLLNAIRKDAAAVFLWGLAVTQLLLYFHIFWLAAARARECGYRVFWLAGILAIVGRVNDFEVFVIPAVVLTSLVLSELAKPSALVTRP